MTLEIITGTKEEWDAALPCPEAGSDIPSYYRELLISAESAGKNILHCRSITLLERQSDNFNLIGDIERTILAHLKEHGCPHTVQIICDSDETARIYKVVYNFWFAEDKPSRMGDASWD